MQSVTQVAWSHGSVQSMAEKVIPNSMQNRGTNKNRRILCMLALWHIEGHWRYCVLESQAFALPQRIPTAFGCRSISCGFRSPTHLHEYMINVVHEGE